MTSNIYTHAKKELDILFAGVPDSILLPVKDEILALCEKFGTSGHSGGSASYTIPSIAQAVKILLSQGILTPLTGEDHEWMLVSERDELYQNNRCSALFKVGKEGKPYYLDAIIWKESNGMMISGDALLADDVPIGSRQFVKSFPFTPKTFYVNVANVFGERRIKSKRDLKAAREYYDLK